MGDVVIDNPILNSPFEEPSRHFRCSDEGITDEVVAERRRSGYFVPVPSACHDGVTSTTRDLVAYWTDEGRAADDAERTGIVEVNGGGHGAEDKRIAVTTATCQWVSGREHGSGAGCSSS